MIICGFSIEFEASFLLILIRHLNPGRVRVGQPRLQEHADEAYRGSRKPAVLASDEFARVGKPDML